MKEEIRGKRFFVTGGAGFIGSNIVEYILERGGEAHIYDNMSSGKKEFVADLKQKGAAFTKADLLDGGRLISTVREFKPDCIIHLAADPNVNTQNPSVLEDGVKITLNVLECMRSTDVKELVFPSSQSVYGNATVKPTPEGYGPLKPISLYAGMKIASEAAIASSASLYGLTFNILRFGNVVGKNSTHGVTHDLVKKLQKNNKELNVLGDGSQRKCYLSVEDALAATFYIRQNFRNEIFNVAATDQISVREIAEMVVEKVAPKAKIKYQKNPEGWPGDILDNFISTEKLRDAGFTPKMNSRQAVQKTIQTLHKN